MAAYRSARRLLLVTAITCSMAQDAARQNRQTAGVVQVPLQEVSTIPIPSLPAESIVMPVFCQADGAILFRLAMPDTGVEDPVAVSSDGKAVVRFGRWKINDITDPVPISVFPSGSDVYILLRGSIPLGFENRWRTPEGKVLSQPALRSGTFIARFERDGKYAGAIALDLPFNPLHLGVFQDGQFLIAGAERGTDEPRIATLGSDGQFRRFVELKGDIHGLTESGISSKGKDPAALPRIDPSASGKSLIEAVSTSQITADGPNLLLFRETGGPVFSISPSGQMRLHKLRMKGDYQLFTLRAVRNTWVAELLHALPQGKGEQLSTYAFDPQTGKPLREYLFPKDLGWGLACTDGNEFSFLIADSEKKTLNMVKLAPGHTPE